MLSERVAAIDCGTNSIRLLIAAGPPPLRDVHREMRIVRLGQGVDETHRFHPEALARTLAAVRDYAEIIHASGAGRIRFAATSAARDAENREQFLGGVEAILGVRPEVISGPEEARLSYAGAARILPASARAIVVDLGGGSTEFVIADDGAPLARSIDVGSVRLTERHLRSDPPTPGEVAAAREDVRAHLTGALRGVRWEGIEEVVGVAGTITTVTAHALGLSLYEPDKINGARLDVARVEAACADLVGRSRAERRSLGFLHPGRVDVIGGGALIWQEILRHLTDRFAAAGNAMSHVVTSEHDILDGLALSLLR